MLPSTNSPSEESITRFINGQRSARTGKTYGSLVGRFLAGLDQGCAPARRDIELFLAQPLKSGGRCSIATYNQILAALRAFAQFAVNENIWGDDPTKGLRFEPEPEKDPAVLFLAEVQEFFRAVPQASHPGEVERDRAILALLFTVGLRVSELARLNVTQVDLDGANLLAVGRKGGRVQSLPLEPNTLHLVNEWLGARSQKVASDEPALFVSRLGTRLSVRSIERLFVRLRACMGTAKRVTPHTARHSFITIDLALGADISVVSRLAGHASITTTMRYRHLVDAEPRRAVGLLGVVIPSELVAGPVNAKAIPRGSDAWSGPLRTVSIDAQENLDVTTAGRRAKNCAESPFYEPGFAA